MWTLALSEEPVFFAIVGGVVATVWVIAATLHAIFKRASFERSRREIAAYVAEGSMTPEDGERLLKAESANMKDA